jgi:hypothetical protein
LRWEGTFRWRDLRVNQVVATKGGIGTDTGGYAWFDEVQQGADEARRRAVFAGLRGRAALGADAGANNAFGTT